MRKKLFFLLVVMSLMALTAPVWAQTGRGKNTDRPKNNSNIECLAAAVNIREQALGSALATHNQALTTAYISRATALKSAYAQTDRTKIKEAVRAAWDAFNKTSKEVRRGWKNSRDSAWRTFRTAAATCRVPLGVVDADKSVNEVSGE